MAEAYLRLKTLPGEQAQVDWAHFGAVRIGRAERRLMGFVMVLSYSRRVFLRFYLDAGMSNFLRGHVAAFEAWQGVPRELWYDNLKSVVAERHGDAIRFNPQLLAFAGHYLFLPRPVAVARGNEKGRVERAIRYVRDSFFAARAWRDIGDGRSGGRWALTVHAFQGRTVDTVIAAIEANHPNLTNQKMLYVEISRARDCAELVTDDKAALREQIQALTGERIAALEAVGDQKVKAPEAGKAAGRDSEVARDPAVGTETGKGRDDPLSPSRDRDGRGMEMGL